MKPIKENLYEKFEEESDPIRDIGIGDLNAVVKHRIKELVRADEEDRGLFSYWFVTHGILDNESGRFCIRLIGQMIHTQQEWISEYCEKRIKEAKLEEFLKSNLKFNDPMQVYWDIKPQYVKCFMAAELNRYSVDEKFKEESDPIKDMGIGAIKIWKEHVKKIKIAAPSWVYNDYFDDSKKPINRQGKCIWQKMYCLSDILKYLIKGSSPQKAFEKACKKVDNGIVELPVGIHPSEYEVMKDIANALEKHFGITVNVTKSVNENFKEESDPIKDMEIGLYAHKDFDTPNKMYEFIVESLTAILHIDKIPKNILNDPGDNIFVYFGKNQRAYSSLIMAYVSKYIRVHGDDIFDWSDFAYVLKLKHPELKSWKYPELNEKFSEEDGDPVRDMGIGGIESLKKILYSIPPGSCSSLYDLYYKKFCTKDYESIQVPLVRLMYHTVKNLIEHPRLTPQQSFEEITKLEVQMKTYSDPKKRLKILTKVAEMLEIKFYLEVDPYFETKKVNEKFEEDTDPIHDMGIGDVNWDDAGYGSVVRVKKYISNIHPINSYIILDEVLRNHDGDITHVTYYSCDDLADLRKSLKHLDSLMYHSWALDKEFIEKYLEIVPKWRIKSLKESVNEKFSEEGDAIGDMNIGQNRFKEEIIKMLPAKYQHLGVDYIDYIHYVLFGDETTVEYNKDILGNTVYTIICKEYSKNKFFEEIMHLIEVKGFVNDKGVSIDETKRKGDRLTIIMGDATKEDVNEKFSVDSDPVSDMGIGMRKTWKKWADIMGQQSENHAYSEYFSDVPKQLPYHCVYILHNMLMSASQGLNHQRAFIRNCRSYQISNVVDLWERIEIAKVLDHEFDIKVRPEFTKKDLSIPLEEKFEEDTDAIKDMGIGSGYRTIPLYGMTKFKSDKNDIESIEGKDIADFLKKSGVTYKMKEEFKSGIVGLIFTGSEKALMQIISQFYGCDAKDKRWIFKIRVNEAFSEESDPIKDLHIGLLKVIQNYADKKVKEGDASWGSGPVDWQWEIYYDPDLDKQTKHDWLDFIMPIAKQIMDDKIESTKDRWEKVGIAFHPENTNKI